MLVVVGRRVKIVGYFGDFQTGKGMISLFHVYRGVGYNLAERSVYFEVDIPTQKSLACKVISIPSRYSYTVTD